MKDVSSNCQMLLRNKWRSSISNYKMRRNIMVTEQMQGNKQIRNDSSLLAHGKN